MKPLKKAVNLRISNDLIIESKSYNINMSQALEEKLLELLRERHEQDWLAQNKIAIESYNERVESVGVFSDDLRNF